MAILCLILSVALFNFYPTYKFFPELLHYFRDVPMVNPFADLVVDIVEPGADGVWRVEILCK